MIKGLLALFLAAPLAAQEAPWDSVSRLLQAPVTVSGDVHRYNLPRSDLSVRINDVTLAPGLALVTWAAFGRMGPDTVVLGDLVLTGAELGPVLQDLASGGIAVTAIHNHLAAEEPSLRYVHYLGKGSPLALAATLRRVLAHTATPVPVRPAAPTPPALDTGLIFRALGASGRASGPLVLMGFNLVPGGVTIGGMAVPAVAYGSPVNFQLVGGGRVVTTGDFAVPGDKAAAIVAVLGRPAGGAVLHATAMHSHLVGETPTLTYIHFWGDGRLADLLAALRAALDAAR